MLNAYDGRALMSEDIFPVLIELAFQTNFTQKQVENNMTIGGISYENQ